MAVLNRFITVQIVFCFLAIGLTGYMLNSTLYYYSNTQNVRVQHAIDLELTQLRSDQDIVEFAKSIKLQYNLDKLIIKNKDNTVIFAEQADLDYLPLLTQLFQNVKPFIRSQHGVGSDLGLKIEFTLRFDHATEIIQSSFFVLGFIFLILAFAPFVTLKLTLAQASSRVSEAISTMVDNYIESDNKNAKLDVSLAQGSISNIFSSIERLNSFLNRKKNDIEKSAFDIKREAYKDSVTGLGNRNLFIEHYEQNIENTDKAIFGSLAIVRCTELNLINQTRGYQQGDEYIKEVSELILQVTGTYSGSSCYRLNSSDFAITLVNVPIKEAEKLGSALQSKFTEYQQNIELNNVANTGIVPFNKGKLLSPLLAQVDTSISLAQTKSTNGFHIQKESDVLDVTTSFGNQNWREVINNVIENNQVQLMIQKIAPTNRSARGYSEIFARFKTADGHTLPTASFLASVEKLNLHTDIDKLIIEEAISAIKTRNLNDQFFGLNVSAKSASDEQFSIWLERRLLKDNIIAAKLIFEVTEFGLHQNIKASKRFIDMVHRVGSRVTVERFGVGLTSFKFFRDLKPDFIKMDASYTRGLEDDKNNQYFMRLMVDLAHRIGVTVFAEGVETLEEKRIIEQLCLDGLQGYYIELPKDI
jgi:EAL domain-containing protein (putative c-di-GMP-specific phosphodiesterase class I)/GGDEF domain-containing protein